MSRETRESTIAADAADNTFGRIELTFRKTLRNKQSREYASKACRSRARALCRTKSPRHAGRRARASQWYSNIQGWMRRPRSYAWWVAPVWRAWGVSAVACCAFRGAHLGAAPAPRKADRWTPWAVDQPWEDTVAGMMATTAASALFRARRRCSCEVGGLYHLNPKTAQPWNDPVSQDIGHENKKEYLMAQNPNAPTRSAGPSAPSAEATSAPAEPLHDPPPPDPTLNQASDPPRELPNGVVWC